MLGLIVLGLTALRVPASALRVPSAPRMASPTSGSAATPPRWLNFLTDRNAASDSWKASSDIIAQHMKTEVVYLNPNDDLKTAGRVLDRAGVTGAPVLDDANKVVGILSQTDLLYKVRSVGGAAAAGPSPSTPPFRNLRTDTAGMRPLNPLLTSGPGSLLADVCIGRQVGR